MVEERKLAKEGGYESPICNTVNDTHDSYNENILKITDGVKEHDRIICASHNEFTVRMLMSELPSRQNLDNINFGQLCGLGDHLSYMLLKNNFSVFKLAPWGEDNIV